MDYALGVGVERIETYVCELARRLREGLSGIKGITVHDKGLRNDGLVTLSHDRLGAVRIRHQLQAPKINTWVARGPSTRLDFEQRKLRGLVRASVHYFNTHGELAHFTDSMRTTVGGRA